MKKFYFTIIIYLTIMFYGKLVFGQTYHPLPTQNAYWSVYEFDELQNVYDDKVYSVEGDTLINGLEYTKVFQLNDHPTIYDTVKILHCFMRQDIEAKKIWFIRHYLGEDNEKLGYDLSAAVGDTVSLPAFDYGNIGDSIYVRFNCDETVTLNNGENRKQYCFASTYSVANNVQQFIEGICNVMSTFPNKYTPFDPFHQSSTPCVEIYNEYLWSLGAEGHWCGFNLVDIQEVEKHTLFYYPNPANNYVTIELPAIQDKSDICLIDILGNYIECSQISSGADQYTLNLSHLPSGIYVIKLKSSSLTYYNKFIISH